MKVAIAGDDSVLSDPLFPHRARSVTRITTARLEFLLGLVALVVAELVMTVLYLRAQLRREVGRRIPFSRESPRANGRQSLVRSSPASHEPPRL